ncbi:MAG: hypothetical protein HRU26_14440 [Psychroserpens sp.]|nr:hypothetical protein [Psychroserpens sp.]
MVRKKIGTIKQVKKKKTDGLLWVQIECSGRLIFLASVYLVPRGSTRWGNNNKIWENLERDIIEFRTKGMVFVVCDMNSRIGNLMSVINSERIYRRMNVDRKQPNQNGRELIRTMNSCGMVVLTGVRKVSKFTCYKEGKRTVGKSVVDHICVDEGILDVVKDDQVREDVMEAIDTDHAMVVVRIKVRILTASESPEVKTKKGGGQDKQIKLNKIRSKEVWSRYEDECKNNKLLRKFLTKCDNKKDNGKDGEEVEELWSEFKELVKIMEE